MGHYVDIAGHLTWVHERGAGHETVLVLHGGLSNSDALGEIIERLAERYRVVAFDRRGHGRTADSPAPFRYDDMATETIGVLEQVVGGAAHLVGCSDGGNVGLLVAMRRPELVRRLVVIGANFHHDGVHPLHVDDDAPVNVAVIQAYAERSPDGPEHYGVMMEKFVRMISTEPTLTVAELAAVTSPTLVIAGDDDLPRLDHTCALYEALPDSQLAVVPGASHAVVWERPATVAALALDFLGADLPPTTTLPIRRR